MKKYGMIASKTRTKIENGIFNIIFWIKIHKKYCCPAFSNSSYDNNINSLKSE